ncbi:IgGFc-binding protein [Lingula anatina]|uniref:IgGFc-binding protein n=1 Tax=Lingula anatina TaxID=7574 RepID=A0A1S3K2F2_LINAN|nr:IgGFc-binding protein [Lingula anatina]|eukprot:XP_013416818.1 IgGFc-binding protein [Lingula anatina]
MTYFAGVLLLLLTGIVVTSAQGRGKRGDRGRYSRSRQGNPGNQPNCTRSCECQACGDPHFTSCDGQRFSYQGNDGNNFMAEQCTGQKQFSIQFRTIPSNSNRRVINNVTVFLHRPYDATGSWPTKRVDIEATRDPDDAIVKINNAVTTLPDNVMSGNHLRAVLKIVDRDSFTKCVEVSTPWGLVVTACVAHFPYRCLFVSFPPVLGCGNICGQCANYNGYSADDCTHYNQKCWKDDDKNGNRG